MKKILFFALLLNLGGISFANAQQVTNEPTKIVVKSNDELIKFARNLVYGASVQAQWQYAQEKGMDQPTCGGAFSPNSNNRFMLRRGYVKLGYNSKYFSSLVQLNVVPAGVSIVNAFVEVNTASKSVAFRAGNIYKHFGYFVAYSSANRLTPEISRGEQSLFVDATGVGGRLQLRDTRDNWTRNFTLNLSYFSGDNMTANTFAGHDFIGKLEYARPVGKFTLGGEFSALYGSLVNVSDNSFHYTGTKYAVTNDVGGKNNDRIYYSFGATVGLVSNLGETKLFGEYIYGDQLGTATSNISPKRNFSATTTDPLYSRKFSNYYVFLQHRILNTNASIIARYDVMNPNTKITKDQIGVAQGSSAADVKYSTFGIGAYYTCFKYVSFSAFYEMVRNEKCPSLSGFENDRKDNLLTLRMQCAF